ncbi:NADP-dependent glyceraldehyde-3-phosphate dehydrogenase [Hydrogenophaga sp. SL48]|uniref:NADP-dependent glyceraldehyde-3-phosphate dehydrogenase n=1 Tax=Hydrogenophaga sp. SL48 TaxID=2806347 RepID=UPI001F4299EB|nr:aldehyde dehydrogenase family protein [Hydrogenophaga sp. SL48]UJW83150.1 NADP-dependent glyceraldehyde-3-phosphate dehydrogenase [Hydrogenophaga sp. SL48]
MSANEIVSRFPAAGDMPASVRAPETIHQTSYLVNGALAEWTGASRKVLSPVCVREADGTLRQVELGSYPEMGIEQADAVLEAASNAFDRGLGLWPTMSVARRIACMQDFVNQMLAKREEIVQLLMWEIGKSLQDSYKEFDRTVEYIEATLSALKDQDNANSRFTHVEGTIGQIRRTPLGVVLCMGPYNYPLNETFCTLIPALLMGNTVVLKPPQYGTLLFQPLLEAFRTAFPPGVVNTIYAPGQLVVPHMLSTGKISVLALIGSSKVADHLKKQHPKSHRLRAVLGLDAKNAAIVLPDADLDVAVRECVQGALSFNGQRCTALKMLLVHRNVADAFTTRLSQAVAALKVGMPWEPGVQITPLPGPHRTAYMTEALEEAKRLGAKVLNENGGQYAGTLFLPAVVYPVTQDMKLYREEQFGPLVPVTPFDHLDEAIEYVITSDHGQQVSIFGQDPVQVGKLVDPLVNQVCRVNLNTQCQRGPDVFPFGGRKDSAEGTLSVTDALRAFSIRSMVATKSTPQNKGLLDTILRERTSTFISTDYIF